ncbi:MAG: type II secretion system protein [Patescibacteria group bacterium]
MKNNKGFTLIELMVVLAIVATLLGLIAINLSSSQQKTSISTTVQTIISDMKTQQIKAMTSDTEGRPTASPYSVHFDANQYVLFYGSAYSSAEPSNFVVPLPPNLQFTTLINVVFSQTSGSLGSAASVTIQNVTTSEVKTIQLNQYGVVTGVN